MQLKSFLPVLWTESIEETIGFYTHILGFKLTEAGENSEWALLTKDSLEIMISSPKSHKTPVKIGFSGSFYFTVNDVNALWEDLKTITKICYGIETFEWKMREFAIYDNNGYILQFGQPSEEIRWER